MGSKALADAGKFAEGRTIKCLIKARWSLKCAAKQIALLSAFLHLTLQMSTTLHASANTKNDICRIDFVNSILI
jgi:hypothetical protein